MGIRGVNPGTARSRDRRPSPRHRRDAGLTLVEVLVAMSMSCVLLAVLGQVVVQSARAARFAMTKTSMTADSRTAVERMSKLLRVAVVPEGLTSAFVAAHYDSVTYYAAWKTTATAADPIPTRVQYSWDPTTKCLTEVTVAGRPIVPTPTSGAVQAWDAPASTRCLVRLPSAPTAAAPLLTYYSSPWLNADGTSPAALVVPVGGLSAASLQTIQSVEITLSAVDPGSTDVAAVLGTNKVTLGNLVIASGGRA